VLLAKRLTSPDAVKEVIHMELDISGAPEFSELMPGDAIGVLPPNPSELVEGLLNRLGIKDPEQKIRIVPTTPGGVKKFLFEI
jgi:sulfite reductase alpha subunit-like flavoprotein